MKNTFKYYKHKLSLFFSILFLFQLILFNTNNKAFAATTPSVSYTVTGEAKVGNIITIAVNVANVTNLYAGSIDFVYDSKLIEVQSVTKGNIFGNNEVLTPIGSNGKIKNGQASFAISMKGNKPGVNSTRGTIAIIKAKVLKEGAIKLNTTNTNTPTLTLNGNTIRVKLSNSNGNNISYNFTNKDISLGNNISINLTSNGASKPLGESLTFIASSNLASNSQYAFYIYIDGAWKLVQSYSSKNTLTYT
ncbi:cohesin domain-containing protein, partial [Clostridium sp.]|uniref:cohesin domain-containing protein n=1 Tax=Clostridium sp. TaxID=1506 RepID=UPI001EC5BA82